MPAAASPDASSITTSDFARCRRPSSIAIDATRPSPSAPHVRRPHIDRLHFCRQHQVIDVARQPMTVDVGHQCGTNTATPRRRPTAALMTLHSL
ncbi:hypothetical protein ACLOJK_006987 [Asimina triloba]